MLPEKSYRTPSEPALRFGGVARANVAGHERNRTPRLVSVIVPVLNQAPVLPGQLAALAAQTYDDPWEVVFVDGGSTDATLEAVRAWTDAPTLVTVVRTHRGINHQRAVGASIAAGDLLAFCDADDAVCPGWLVAMVRAARGADIVGGALELHAFEDPLGRGWRNRETPDGLIVQHDFLPTVPGGNCSVWKPVALSLGWDPSFGFGSSDIEFSWRAQAAGYRVTYAPDAVVAVRQRRTRRALVRQWFRYGVSGPALYRRFGPQGMPRSPRAEWLRDWRWLVRNVSFLGRSPAHQGKWLQTVAFRCGRVAGSLRGGVVFL